MVEHRATVEGRWGSQDSRGGAHTELGSPRILLLQLSLRTDYRSIPGASESPSVIKMKESSQLFCQAAREFPLRQL